LSTGVAYAIKRIYTQQALFAVIENLFLVDLQIPIVLHKQPELDESGNPAYDAEGKQRYRCGFRIGGGIDQDPLKSPQGYPDRVKQFTIF